MALACTASAPTPPPGDAVLGGQPIGKDVGYGPMRYLTADEVKVSSAALSALSDNDFRRRCDPAALRAAEAYAIDYEDDEL